jgi:hypothetical protein
VQTGIKANANYTITVGSATNAGNYTATVSLSDTANYVWEDGTKANITLSWSIAKAKITKPTITNTAIVYTGSEQSVGIVANAKYTIAGDKATNAGNHIATVSLSDTANYVWEDGTKANITLSWWIAKAKITKPVVYTALVYTGSVQYAEIATNEAYTITGNSAIPVGNYLASVALKNKTNYEWLDGTTIDLVLNWSIVKADAKEIRVIWGENRKLVYNKMVQHPQWSIEPAEIDKSYIRIINAQSVVGNYTKENNLAPFVMILPEYNRGDYRLVNTSVDYEITPKPLDIALKDKEGKITDEVKVEKATRITVGDALNSLKTFIGYNGFAVDTLKNEADNAANSLSGEPKFEVLKVESGTRSRSSVRDEGFKLSDFLDNGEYVVNIKVSDIFTQNYKLDDGQAVLKVSDLFFSFSISRDGDDTPIHQKQKGDRKYGILLEKAIVSQPVKISVKTPEQAQINLAIYDNAGNMVYKTSGKNSDTFVWNLTNAASRNVANGSYLIVAEAKGAKGTYAYSAKVGVKR